MKEQDIQRTILEYLQYQPQTFVWRQNAGGLHWKQGTKQKYMRFASVDGISDILGIYFGLFLAIEVKKKPNKPTETQRSFLNQVQATGGIAIVAYDVDDVKNALAQVQAQHLQQHKPSYFGVFGLK